MRDHIRVEPQGRQSTAAPARPTRGSRPGVEPRTCPRIVAIGGGTGLPAVLEGLAGALTRAYGEALPADAITAVVTATDDGGSSGRLRRELGILPPGDVRNCLVALAGEPSLGRLLQHRLRGGGIDGHAIGNLLLAALTDLRGDFVAAVEELSAILRVRGRVLPSTRENVQLRAQFHDGAVVVGETAIVERRSRIRRLALERPARPLPETIAAIVNADAIVVGPGSLYTSVLPNLLVDGIASTLSGVNAVRIYVANLMTEPGETDGYTLDDHLRAIAEHTGYQLFDYVVFNRQPIEEGVAARYARAHSVPVRLGTPLWRGHAVLVESDLVAETRNGKIRHEPDSLARVLLALVRQGRPS
ncbi:MAG TPA: gluconeogenesis factor YvcK family protein [Vicinamibacterales bacterium]|nr:gluconeogenesis factor YvcK family protein [Vicinamibacterales bacterium]